MNIALWIIQVLLAAAFILAGVMKTFRPIDSLAPQLTWVKVVPAWLVRFIGVAELLGGIGLLVPALTGIDPWLTPLAAAALAVVMLLAVIFHVARSEMSRVAPSFVLGILAAVAAYGRLVLVPLGNS
jgi:putative oxidoreductase